MTQINKLSDNISVCMQIFPEQLDFIKEQGFTTIINNRPDMEKPGQPFAADIEKLARNAGLEYVHLPMQPGQITPELIAAMAEVFSKAEGPILAHCASGMRSTILWCFVNVKEMGVDAVISAATHAGVDVEKIRPALTGYAAQ
ncbi:MAG: TIGR01244 family sulfur transferase [Robiginitomaculum sp.]|nr:TIGR01244 family sulfur transferase [Robiginitomaculum sp.]